MTEYVFPPPQTPSVGVAGQKSRFPIRRIFCVGRNYEAHAREMGKDPTREPPFFFMKPADTALDTPVTIIYPPETKNLQYEIELVVAIGKGGIDIQQDRALEHVWGYTVGIDLTRRDLQLAARDAGRPWSWGKSFDKSAPMAPLRPVSEVGHPQRGRIWLAVNGQVKQDQDISDLIWKVPEIIAIVSRSIGLQPGDLIMTGTPAGVGAIVAGDMVTAGVDGVGELSIAIA